MHPPWIYMCGIGAFRKVRTASKRKRGTVRSRGMYEKPRNGYSRHPTNSGLPPSAATSTASPTHQIAGGLVATALSTSRGEHVRCAWAVGSPLGYSIFTEYLRSDVLSQYIQKPRMRYFKRCTTLTRRLAGLAR